MQINELSGLLRANEYPGRGIVIGMTEQGESLIAYFIMGRSENSRNRVFEQTEDGIRTKAFEPEKLTDPSLVIYHPVRRVGDVTVVTNGDQTDTVSDALKEGKSYIEALRTRGFEPDGPIFTPRISGVLCRDGAYALSILKSLYGDPDTNARYFFEYDRPRAGLGHFIHTYKENAKTPPSFEGEPVPVRLSGTAETIAGDIWQSLDESNKVSLYVMTANPETGETKSVILNKNM